MNIPSLAPSALALLALATATLAAGEEMFSETMHDGKISIRVDAPNTADGNTVDPAPEN